jgi:copper(I)-binding protein
MFAACYKRLLAIVLLLPTLGITQEALTMSDGWVRATPPNSRTSAAYFTLHNRGDTPLVVTRARASIAGAAELHNWREEDGMKRMYRMHEVPLAAGEELQFVPGGRHMMMFRLDPVPAIGDIVTLCVGTESGDEACVEAPVKMP